MKKNRFAVEQIVAVLKEGGSRNAGRRLNPPHRRRGANLLSLEDEGAGNDKDAIRLPQRCVRLVKRANVKRQPKRYRQGIFPSAVVRVH